MKVRCNKIDILQRLVNDNTLPKSNGERYLTVKERQEIVENLFIEGGELDTHLKFLYSCYADTYNENLPRRSKYIMKTYLNKISDKLDEVADYLLFNPTNKGKKQNIFSARTLQRRIFLDDFMGDNVNLLPVNSLEHEQVDGKLNINYIMAKEFTNKQSQVAKLISMEYTQTEMANELNISRNQVRKVIEKLENNSCIKELYTQKYNKVVV